MKMENSYVCFLIALSSLQFIVAEQIDESVLALVLSKFEETQGQFNDLRIELDETRQEVLETKLELKETQYELENLKQILSSGNPVAAVPVQYPVSNISGFPSENVMPPPGYNMTSSMPYGGIDNTTYVVPPIMPFNEDMMTSFKNEIETMVTNLNFVMESGLSQFNMSLYMQLMELHEQIESIAQKTAYNRRVDEAMEEQLLSLTGIVTTLVEQYKALEEALNSLIKTEEAPGDNLESCESWSASSTGRQMIEGDTIELPFTFEDGVQVDMYIELTKPVTYYSCISLLDTLQSHYDVYDDRDETIMVVMELYPGHAMFKRWWYGWTNFDSIYPFPFNLGQTYKVSFKGENNDVAVYFDDQQKTSVYQKIPLKNAKMFRFCSDEMFLQKVEFVDTKGSCWRLKSY